MPLAHYIKKNRALISTTRGPTEAGHWRCEPKEQDSSNEANRAGRESWHSFSSKTSGSLRQLFMHVLKIHVVAGCVSARTEDP